jgi:membrane-associated protease RseP (regulator of RpoE activity)
MTEIPDSEAEKSLTQLDFEQMTKLVSSEFKIEGALMEHGLPTYHLAQPQETKQAFLRLLKSLEPLNFIAVLRRIEGKIVLKVIPKPPVKPSNIVVNWALFFATIATTFATGYLLSLDIVNPFVGGATFMVAMLAVLGVHEFGHKITANKRGVDATAPYFIPGLPPYGTFGAVIMQKSLAPNRDSLFDVGADGPIAGFIVATIVSIIGLTTLVSVPSSVGSSPLSLPILWIGLVSLLGRLNMIPQPPSGQQLVLHPVGFAGWVGLLVTMLNLLPAAMLDGGHVARSVLGENEKLRLVLTGFSILYLLVEQFYPMAILVLFISMVRHPGPLDDVSSLSMGRKLVAVGLVAIFVLCTIPSLPSL